MLNGDFLAKTIEICDVSSSIGECFITLSNIVKLNLFRLGFLFVLQDRHAQVTDGRGDPIDFWPDGLCSCM